LLSDDSPVRIVSKLPFGGRPVGRGEQTEGFVLAAIELEESGDDRTLFIVSLPNEISMDTARKKIANGIDGSAILGFSADETGDRRFVLVDVPGFFCNRAEVFQRALTDQGLDPEGLSVVGAYGVPIPEDALS